MRVTLDVFSGRPNPSWELSAKEASDFRDVLRRLPRSNAASEHRAGMGYRGIVVSSANTYDDEFDFDEVRLFNEVITVRTSRSYCELIDQERQLEQALLQTARAQIDPSLFEIRPTCVDELRRTEANGVLRVWCYVPFSTVDSQTAPLV